MNEIGRKVLIVDDNPHILTMMLELKDVLEVKTANGGTEALRLLIN